MIAPEPFTLILRPEEGGGKEEEEEATKSKPSLYDSYTTQASAPQTTTLIPVVNALRKKHPHHALGVTFLWQCNIHAYARAGHAELRKVDDESTGLVLLSYVPPSRRLDGEKGVMDEEVVFGQWELRWKEKEVTVYIVECFRQGRYPVETRVFFLHKLETEKGGVKRDEEEKVVEGLITEVSAWMLELHGEVWLFDQLNWKKDRALWESVQEARWEDVILDEEMKRNIRGDIEGFFDEREEYEKFAIPWKVCVFFSLLSFFVTADLPLKRGIILYGPPGNGKTITIKALMKTLINRSHSPPVATLYVKSFSQYQFEHGIRRVFAKARETAPCLLIFEDVDSLVTPQSRSYFLNEVDGLEKNDGVLMLGSTNHRKLDPFVRVRRLP